jgi:hypothetical protein
VASVLHLAAREELERDFDWDVIARAQAGLYREML